jgi:hypothetical protein
MNKTEITITLTGKLEVGYWESEGNYNRRIVAIDDKPLDNLLGLLNGEDVTIVVTKGITNK